MFLEERQKHGRRYRSSKSLDVSIQFVDVNHSRIAVLKARVRLELRMPDRREYAACKLLRRCAYRNMTVCGFIDPEERSMN